jgi:hypothetical protein
MARLLALITLVCALWTHASAQANLYEVCQGFDFRSGRDSCFEVIGGGYFELEAARFCVNHARFDSGRRQCLLNIKDKTFDEGALQACSREFPDSSLNHCVALVARDYLPFAGGCSVTRAQALVESSLAFIEAGRYASAYDTLLVLRELLSTCR